MSEQTSSKETAQQAVPAKKLEGAKYAITGMGGAGKTTLISKIEDPLVIYSDIKRFPLKVPFIEITNNKKKTDAYQYKNIKGLTEMILEKIIKYGQAYGKYPKTLVFDTITTLYRVVSDHIETTTKNNYGSHSKDIGVAMSALFNWIESEIIPAGINVVFLAHSIKDGDGETVIATTGSRTFSNTGGIFGTVNYCSFIYIDEGVRLIAHSSLAFPATSRSLLTDVPEVEALDDFDPQKMLDDIREQENGTNEFRL